MNLTFRCFQEDKPGEKWKTHFDRVWPLCETWFLSQGYQARPGYITSVGQLELHMPELLPLYHELVALAGGEDIKARFLSMYCPPSYMSGCTQVAFTQGVNTLIRNYDYSLKLFEGTMMYTHWLQPVMGVSDSTWGLLDGMNGSGLAISLTFGGRMVSGVGFGIPIVIRYILETAHNSAEALAILQRIPVHMSYNITVLDKQSNYATVHLAPDKLPEVQYYPIATNHQQVIDWIEFANMTATVQRKEYVQQLLNTCAETEDSLMKKFLLPPLYNTNFEKNFGTLYTIAYKLQTDEAEIMWPKQSIKQRFNDFKDIEVELNLEDKANFL